MNADITNFVKKYKGCEKYRNNNIKEPPILHEFPELACDILEYGEETSLTAVDYLTKWAELIPLRDNTSTNVIKELRNIFSIHGIPETIVADNMPFGSAENVANQ